MTTRRPRKTPAGTPRNEQWLAERCVRDPFSGCVLWQRSVDGQGYGQYGERGEYYKAHRLAWALANGMHPRDIPSATAGGVKLVVMHTCQERACCNPLHLELETAAAAADLSVCGGTHGMTKKTHCVHGHTLDDALVSARGWRTCRTCKKQRDTQRTAQKRKRAVALDEMIADVDVWLGLDDAALLGDV